MKLFHAKNAIIGQNVEVSTTQEDETRITNNDDDSVTKEKRTWKDLKLVRTFTTKPETPEEVVDRIDFMCLIFLPNAYTLWVHRGPRELLHSSNFTSFNDTMSLMTVVL